MNAPGFLSTRPVFVVGIGYFLGKKNPKIDTAFITNFAANVGTPAMIIYALNPVYRI